MSAQESRAEVMEPRDELQVFRLGGIAEGSVNADGRVVANSSHSRIATFELRRGESSPELRAQPDCEQILYVMEGECSRSCEAGEFLLKKDQGFLVPADVRYAVSNPANARAVLLLMRTVAPPDEQVSNAPSDLRVKLPFDELSGGEIRAHFELYAMTRHSIGVSFLLTRDWNEAALMRMHAPWEIDGDTLWVTVPQRFAEWYGLERLDEGDYRFVPDGTDRTRGRILLGR